MHDFSVQLPKGNFKIAGLRNQHKAPSIVCLHGWLDNAASFAPLLDALPDYSISALDLPGHGQSDWLPEIVPAYSMHQALFMVHDYLKILDQPVVLIGHSLGAGIATLIAALFPESIKGLVLLDNLTPLAHDESAFKHLNVLAQASPLPNKSYATMSEALEVRMKSGVSQETAQALAQRSVSQNLHGEFYWNHDPRLKSVSLAYFSTQDIKDFIAAVHCKSLYMHGDWDFKMQERQLASHLFQNQQRYKVSGDHYFHMHNLVEVLPILKDFLASL